MAMTGVPRWALAWLKLLSLLVPPRHRESWLREWAAEVAFARRRGVGPRLLIRTLLAAFDAAWLAFEDVRMETMTNDLKLAARGLARSPLFTTLALLTLALGIGANTAIFTVVNGVLLRPLPFPAQEELLSVGFTAPGLGYDEIPWSDQAYVHASERLRSVRELGIYAGERVVLVGDGPPQEVRGARATASLFRALGVDPMLGRTLVDDDELPGAEPVVVLSHGLWRSRFGEEPGIVGQLVEMDGVQRRVVGVMPPGFRFPDAETRVWRAFTLDPARFQLGAFSFPGLARMAEGATPETVRAEMERMVGGLPEAFPDELPASLLEQAQWAPTVASLKDQMVGDVRQPLWIVLGTVGVVLLIACANVANLFLVRAEGRSREVALRTALGADRRTLARFFITESLVLATAAGLVGLVLAQLGVRGFLAMAPESLPRVGSIGFDWNVAGFLAGVTVGAGVLFGFFPLFRAGRLDLAGVLKDAGGRGSTGGPSGQRTRSVLVVAQVALALVLLVGSGLMLRSFANLRNIDPGFETAGRLVVPLRLPGASYDGGETNRIFYRDLLARVGALRGVEATTLTSSFPLAGERNNGSIGIEDHPEDGQELPPLAERIRVAPRYFRTMGIPILEGRAITADDGADGIRGVVVSRSFAERWWPGESALGRRVRPGGGEWWEIVGVAEDHRFFRLQEEPGDALFFPMSMGEPGEASWPNGVSLVAEVRGDPMGLVSAVRDVVWGLDGRLPITAPTTAEEVVADAMSSTSFTMVLLGIAAAVALLLGAVGIYGVISYVVSQRVQEIGVRMALGAPAGTVLTMVIRQGLVLAALGIVIGLVGAGALSSVIQGLLFGVEAVDPWTYGGVSVTLALIALASSWIPAWRASRVDPVEALRSE